jgi:hypothetical protein
VPSRKKILQAPNTEIKDKNIMPFGRDSKLSNEFGAGVFAYANKDDRETDTSSNFDVANR